MRLVLVIMTGIGFTLGILIGLFIQLPVGTLPADTVFVDDADSGGRYRRSLADVAHVERRFVNSDRRAGFHRVPLGSAEQQNTILLSDPIIGLKPIVPLTNNVNDVDSILHGTNKSFRDGRSNQVRSGLRKGQRTDGKQHGRESQFNGDGLDFKHRVRGTHTDNAESIEKGLAADSDAENKQARQSLSVRIKVHGAAKPNINMKNSNTKKESALSDSDKHMNSDEFSELLRAYSGIYWNSNFTQSCPTGFTGADSREWKKKTDDLQIVKVEEGCGRMQNRLLTFSDASRACARYRLNVDQIQGEIYSYYLAKLLNITNLAPTLLLGVNSLDDKWKAVHLDLVESQWADDKVVILTQWVTGLSPAYIPHLLQKDDRRLHPTDDILLGKNKNELCELVQWSDLIVFDYLTANLDRVVNNMFNKQWNDQMMSNPAHNLEQTSDGSLLFLDNESGLFHGYRLLDKYADFHKQLLNSLCVFRESTVQRVRELYHNGNIGEELHKLFSQNDKLHLKVPDIPEKNIKILKHRLEDVYNQITQCDSQYGR
ncbi:four-jointed box protein 1-like [Gigantopelta aegis]|uniref:four-jointed box protein 1-like n=1 Tax=Gigantopelta aegis TaxID=1735272 RepID=UPI001B88D978|nr:four-jointed box protein 1-like [Gigantopelta aegis]XP_041354940.1 four-jointed box protein 1-like [Gigantopelta aegis]XP_041354941.1 four-jointed box protein 1-like [Gigantopelta aegis]